MQRQSRQCKPEREKTYPMAAEQCSGHCSLPFVSSSLFCTSPRWRAPWCRRWNFPEERSQKLEDESWQRSAVNSLLQLSETMVTSIPLKKKKKKKKAYVLLPTERVWVLVLNIDRPFCRVQNRPFCYVQSHSHHSSTSNRFCRRKKVTTFRISVCFSLGKLKERQPYSLSFIPQQRPLVSAQICTGMPHTSVLVNKAAISRYSAAPETCPDCSVLPASSWMERERGWFWSVSM